MRGTHTKRCASSSGPWDREDVLRKRISLSSVLCHGKVSRTVDAWARVTRCLDRPCGRGGSGQSKGRLWGAQGEGRPPDLIGRGDIEDESVVTRHARELETGGQPLRCEAHGN